MAKSDTVPMIEVDFKGKTFPLTEKDYKKLHKDLVTPLATYTKLLQNRMKTYLKIHESYLETGRLRNGYLKAVSLAVVLKVGQVSLPDVGKATSAMSAVAAADRDVRSGKLAEAETSLTLAEKAVNAYMDEMNAFLLAVGQKSKQIGTTLEVTTATGFIILGAMGGSVLVAGGMTAAQAAAASAASVSALQSYISVVSRAALGQKIDLYEEVKAYVMDALIAGATAGMSSKLPPKFVDKVCGKLASELAKKITGGSAFNTRALAPLIGRFLSGGSTGAITTAMEGVVKMMGEHAKSGKMPTEKEFIELSQGALLAVLTGGLGKNLSTFNAKWTSKAGTEIEVKLVPDALKKLVGNKTLTKADQAKVVGDVVDAVSGKLVEKGVTTVLGTISGSESPDKMVSIAEKAVTDSSIKKAVEKETERSLKKHKLWK